MRPRSRRHFLGTTALTGGLAWMKAETRKVSILVLPDASGPTAAGAPVQWAVGQLRSCLTAKGIPSTLHTDLGDFNETAFRVVVAPGTSQIARRALSEARLSLPALPESLGIVSTKLRGRPALLLTGADTRGLVYSILEVVDRIRYGDAAEILADSHRVLEQPANEIRSVQRLFVSDVEDKGWFNDRNFWTEYLSELAAQRFNRFSLTLGLGYDLPRNVLDSYFIFCYPFFLREVPGYKVTVPGLAPDEVESNLAMLKWISAETAARGLHFQLSLWSQTYKWIDSPKANYVVQGLNDSNHAAYCRDALKLLIRECPAISGITLRAHSESGIGDGSYDFWKTVFSGIGNCGRRMELDLHSKGIESRLIQMAIDTGQPVRVSTKYAAEHMGLPGHQIEIRELERNRPSSTPQERAFTRYGYADYLAEDRAYGTYFRLWPGKERVLLWGDPALAAGYGRYSSFCGSLGLELCEPMSFKGRQGSGLHQDRRIYQDPSLAAGGEGWKKYLYTYRLWGRHLYNPGCDPESYRRYLRREFGASASAAELSLANASKVIPLVTSSHLPSASGMTFWPEVYSNMPIGDESQRPVYGDTPSPKVFGRVSPLDPGLFMSAAEYVSELTGQAPSGRYTPADVARWLDAFATAAEEHLRSALAAAGGASSPSLRRLEIDVRVQLGLGRFFAAKMRSAVSWELYQAERKPEHLRGALFYARSARDAWKEIVAVTKGAYVPDLNFGDVPHRRGSWADRLPSVEQDVRFFEKLHGELAAGVIPPAPAWLDLRRDAPPCQHQPAHSFTPGKPLSVRLSAPDKGLAKVWIRYRHVTHAERFTSRPMTPDAGHWSFEIGADYTNSPYPLQYYFQLAAHDGTNWLWPGLAPDLANQPYYVVRSAAGRP